jgi:outer membrane lipoprotein-sorting protein
VPKKTGRVARLDVRVDDATATIRGYTWTYSDGGFVTFDQTFTNVGRDYLVAKQSGHVELPSYKADVVSNFSNYQLNVTIPNGVFDAS